MILHGVSLINVVSKGCVTNEDNRFSLSSKQSL